MRAGYFGTRTTEIKLSLFSREELDGAVQLVSQVVDKTPAHQWPQLAALTGCDVVVKHENHTATGAFKVRGGITYVDALRRRGETPKKVISATRGNHGQSVPFASSRVGVESIILVPEGNSREKNAAMRALGAELEVFGSDFEEARQEALRRSEELGYHFVPPFHRSLCVGVATYAFELFSDHSDLDTVYVPIGMGSGICGLITVRDLLGLKTKIVGVVAENAPAYALSFEAGKLVTTESAATFVDGVACRKPMEEPLELILKGAERVVTVSEDQVAEAMRVYFSTTHNVAESAGAAPLAGLLKEKDAMAGRKVGLILCGGNVDSEVFAQVLNGQTPTV